MSSLSDPSFDFDLIVIGGGINGCGIARDAQGRGLRTLLVEQDDLAAHTSSASTKLIHGGLRYLEQYEFSLVRKALREREVLLQAAPHIARGLRFIMPYDPGMRPLWLIRLGMWLYDHLARRRRLSRSTCVDLRQHPAGAPLGAEYTRAFEYADGWVDDARLVVLNALDAAERGAQIRTRCRAVGARRHDDHWELDLHGPGPDRLTVRARAVVNASGPWVDVLDTLLGVQPRHAVRLVKGSHIIVRRLFDHPYAYLFQNPDRRIIFAIPYEGDYTLIGTTDVDYRGDPAHVAIDATETAYLCEMVDRYFARKIGPGDVVRSYSGVRPLVQETGKNAAEVTRDYVLELDGRGAPLVSVFGGKITTYRVLAEEAVDHLQRALGSRGSPWTETAGLPGGDLDESGADGYAAVLRTRYPFLSASLAIRYARNYGTRALRFLSEATGRADLGNEIAPGLFEAELHYMCDVEWALTAEDVLWRRSKVGLHSSEADALAVADWLLTERRRRPADCSATDR